MGLFDAIKGAVNAATGGGARVGIEFSPDVVAAGDEVSVKVRVTSSKVESRLKQRTRRRSRLPA